MIVMMMMMLMMVMIAMMMMMMMIQLFDLLCSPAGVRPVDTVVRIPTGPSETFDSRIKQFDRLKYFHTDLDAVI